MSVIANVAINVDSRDAVNKLRQVQSQAQTTERAFEALNNVVAAFGAGFAISKVIQDVKELDTNLRRLGTVGGDVKALDKGLGDLSKRLDGIVNKAELAAASYQGLSAGFTDTAGNLRLVEAATKAAIGGMADTTQVVEVLTKTLNAYGMSGSDAVKVTDSISKAIEYGQVEWSDYTSQLGRVASVAAIAGISLDEVNAFIAAATKNGATAEIAFTGLGAAIQTILQPTKESQEAAKSLGIQWNLAGLQAKGFDGLLADLAKKQDTNKEAAARLLGSQEAMRGIFAANAKAGKDYQMILAGLQGAAGKTQSDFDQMKVSLENQLKALDTAFKNLSEALGTAFGASVVSTVKNVADAINVVADVIKAIPQPVKTATGELIKLIAQMILLQKAIQAIIGLRAAFVATMTGMAATTTATGTAAKTSAGAFALYTSNTRALQAQAAAATPVMAGLLATLRNLAALGVITVGINLVVTGLQQAIAANAEINKLRGERKAGGVAKSFGGTATVDQKAQAQKTLAAIKAERQRLAQPGGVITRGALGALAPLVGQLTPSAVAERNLLLRAREQKAQAILGLPTRAETTGAGLPDMPSNPYDSDAGKEKKKGKTDAERAAERLAKQTKEQLKAAQDLQFTQRNQLSVLRAKEEFEKAFVTFGTERAEIERRYNELLANSKSQQETQLLQQARAAEYKQNSLKLEQQIQNLTKQATAPLDEIVKRIQDQVAFEREYGELVKNGTNPELAKQIIEIRRAYDESVKALEPALASAQAAVTKAEAEGASATQIQKYREELERIEKIRKSLEGKKSEAEAGAAALQPKEKSPQETIQNRITKLNEELQKLTNIGNIAITVADGIGAAFGNAFNSLISGSVTAQQALSDFFKSIGDMFIGMAVEIITKQLTMILLQSILKALGGPSFGGGGGSMSSSFTGSFQMPDYMKGVTPFPMRAGGGAVSSNSAYMVGERGPELFVPGTGGSVVPTNDLRAAMGAAPGSSGAPVLNMSFETSTINGVEYVSRDQLEAAMAATRRQAARDGAQRGMTMTLDRLQQSPNTRRRVGF